MVEVIAEDGRPCAPGETGRVVITHLHGFAMPIIRYEIGDLATVGKPCRCGRGLPVLTRIVGRQRNMMIGAKGERFRPSLGWKHIRRMAPIDQGQFVQTAVDRLEAKVVAKRALTDAEADAVRAHLKSRMPQLKEIAFVYVDDVPRSESGKFEDFISLLRPDDTPGAA
jgi:phenylacetate-CoA ligase